MRLKDDLTEISLKIAGFSVLSGISYPLGFFHYKKVEKTSRKSELI
jgi:hypothetical protein